VELCIKSNAISGEAICSRYQRAQDCSLQLRLMQKSFQMQITFISFE